MITRELVIQNEYGLHARPAALFVEAAAQFDSKVTISKDGVEINGKSIMGVLVLAAEKGDQIILHINGKDENEAIEVLSALLEGELDKNVKKN